jgi:hypothetical protein
MACSQQGRRGVRGAHVLSVLLPQFTHACPLAQPAPHWLQLPAWWLLRTYCIGCLTLWCLCVPVLLTRVHDMGHKQKRADPYTNNCTPHHITQQPITHQITRERNTQLQNCVQQCHKPSRAIAHHRKYQANSYPPAFLRCAAAWTHDSLPPWCNALYV